MKLNMLKVSVSVLSFMIFQTGNCMQVYMDRGSESFRPSVSVERESPQRQSEEKEANDQLIQTGERGIVLFEGNVAPMVPRTNGRNRIVLRREENRYTNEVEFDGDKAVISFVRGRSKGEQFIISDRFKQKYSYEKIFKGLKRVDVNHSCAIYEVFADTQEVGRLKLEDNFVDGDNLLKHQKRVFEATDNDDELVSIGKVETYVTVNGNDQIVRKRDRVRVPYILSRTETDESYLDAPDGGDNVNVYVRYDGEEVRRNWQGKALVKKNPSDVTNSSKKTEILKEKVFSGLKKVNENHSYAVYEVFVNTPEGKIKLTNNFVDTGNVLEHQKREKKSANNDDELVTIKDVETYVIVDGKEQIIRKEEGVRFPYKLVRTERDPKYEDAPDGGNNVNVYARWNGEEIRRAWNGLALVEKPPQASPVGAPSPQRREERHSSGGLSSNVFEAAGQVVGGFFEGVFGGLF